MCSGRACGTPVAEAMIAMAFVVSCAGEGLSELKSSIR